MQKEIYRNYLDLMFGRDFARIAVVILAGLPGSGKSTLAMILEEQYGYKYVSTDKARVEMLKLTKGKYAATAEYVVLKDKVYEFVRQLAGQYLHKKHQVVIDGTHLNEQLEITLEYLRGLGIVREQILIIYVDGGSKSEIRKRFEQKEGINADGRNWVEAWETAYDYFCEKIREGLIKVPENSVVGYEVIWVKNC